MIDSTRVFNSERTGHDYTYSVNGRVRSCNITFITPPTFPLQHSLNNRAYDNGLTSPKRLQIEQFLRCYVIGCYMLRYIRYRFLCQSLFYRFFLLYSTALRNTARAVGFVFCYYSILMNSHKESGYFRSAEFPAPCPAPLSSAIFRLRYPS